MIESGERTCPGGRRTLLRIGPEAGNRAGSHHATAPATRRASRRLRERLPRCLILALAMLGPSNVPAETADEPLAEIRIAVEDAQPLWVGMQATLQIELLTTGLTFSDQFIALPEVPGALLLQTDSTTLKLTERRGSTTWQRLRYPVALFPQRAGELTVPPFEVRFAVSAGYGKPPKTFSFRTAPLTFTTRLPPGVDADALLITTTDYDLTWSWSPAPMAAEDDGDPVLVLAPGDAITLTVTQRATDLSGMVLPELPVHESEGMAAYPALPDVEDRVTRGALVGTRTDAVTWMVERPGRQRIPGLSYQWFDPARGSLRRAEVPGLEVSVIAPAATQATEAGTAPAPFPQGRLEALAATALGLGILALVLVWALRRGTVGRLSAWHTARRTHRAHSEPMLFRAAERACATHDARAAYSALSRWQRSVAPAPSLLDASADLPETQALLAELQGAIADARDWDGARLRARLPELRRHCMARGLSTHPPALIPLNPTGPGHV